MLQNTTNIYFKTKRSEQYLELLQHMCQYSDHILLVTGEPGIGKSTLQKTLISSSPNNLKFLKLDAKEEISNVKNEELLDKISNTFTSYDSENPEPSQFDNKSHILTIDNAEILPQYTLSKILELSTINNNLDNPLHILLFANKYFEKELNSLVNPNKIHLITLQPLDLTETVDFLMFKCKLHNSIQLPLNKKQLKKIYALSKGNPAKIEQLYQSLLEGNTQNITTQPEIQIIKQLEKQKSNNNLLTFVMSNKNLLYTFFFSALIFSLFFILLNNGSQEPIENSTEYYIAENIKTKDHHIKNLELILEQHTADLSLANDQIKHLKSEIRDLLQLKQQEEKKNKMAKIKPIKTTPKHPLLSYNPDHYNLQLLGTTKEINAKNFITKNNLSKNAHYYETTYKNKPWFVVIYGDYSTQKMAKNAVASLPSNIKQLNPYTRTFKSVQKSIKTNS